MEQRSFIIDLTPEEATLADAIKFDPRATLGNTAAFHANGDLVVRLTDRLLARKAVPDHRLGYFSDPECNVGGRGSSRQDLFMRQAGEREKMVRHGHFLTYLHYFIYGPALPARTIDAFAKAVENCGMVTSGDIAPLCQTAKQLTRSANLERKAAADEFFKLCLELELSPSHAVSIRSAVMQLR